MSYLDLNQFEQVFNEFFFIFFCSSLSSGTCSFGLISFGVLHMQLCNFYFDLCPDFSPPLRYRPCATVNAAPEFDANAFSSKYMAPLQYITWRKMFQSLKPGNK